MTDLECVTPVLKTQQQQEKKNRKGRQKKVIDRPTSVSCSRYEKGALSESGTCKTMKYRSLFFFFFNTCRRKSSHNIHTAFCRLSH